MVYNTALAKRMSAARRKGPPSTPLVSLLHMQDIRQSPCLNNFCLNNFVAVQQKMH
jgi:hypothetical protein